LPLLFPHKDEEQIFPLNLPDTATLIAILVSQDTVKPISVVNVSHFTLGLIILNPKEIITYLLENFAIFTLDYVQTCDLYV
jgi:hypothetical protein